MKYAYAYMFYCFVKIKHYLRSLEIVRELL